MNTETTELKDRISKLSDEELLKMVSVNSADYRKEALDFAIEELAKRGLPLPSYTETISNFHVEPEYKGVGGWLLLLCLSLTIFTPIARLVNLTEGIKYSNTYSAQFSSLFNVLIIDGLLGIGVVCFSIYAGFSLWTVKRNAVKIAKTCLFVFLVHSVIVVFLYFMAGLSSQDKSTLLLQGTKMILPTVIYFAVWYAYLSNSKRVKATYIEE